MSKLQYTSKIQRAVLEPEVPRGKELMFYELWYRFLAAKGYNDTMDDMKMAWLGDLGYSGSLEQRWDDYFFEIMLPRYNDLKGGK